MGILQSTTQYDQPEENKQNIDIDTDELNETDIKEGMKYELDEIQQFKIDQNKVINGYVREHKLKYKLLFAHDLFKVIQCFYGSNCCEFYGSINLNKYKKETTLESSCNFIKLSKFSNLCMDIDQFQYRYDIILMTATNNILSIKDCDDDIFYQHSFKTNQTELIINNDPSGRSFIYCIKQKLLYGIGYNSETSFWKNVNDSSLVLFHGLSKFFQNLDVNIKDIACGLGHTLFLTDNGDIYSCGRNDDSQCGFKEYQCDEVEIPTKISLLSKFNIIAIAAGSLHSICLDDGNNLWCFGSNVWGQAGIGIFKSTLLPIKNAFYKNINIQQIVCGNRTSIIIDNKGKCYMCGENKNNPYGGFGQCGYKMNENLCIPNMIQSLLIKQASNSYNHTLLLTLENKVYSMGNNQCLQCSPFSNKVSNIFEPYYLSKKEMGIIDYMNVKKVIAMSDASIVVTT